MYIYIIYVIHMYPCIQYPHHLISTIINNFGCSCILGHFLIIIIWDEWLLSSESHPYSEATCTTCTWRHSLKWSMNYQKQRPEITRWHGSQLLLLMMCNKWDAPCILLDGDVYMAKLIYSNVNQCKCRSRQCLCASFWPQFDELCVVRCHALHGSAAPYYVAGYVSSGSIDPEPQLLHIPFQRTLSLIYMITDIVMVNQSGYCRLITQPNLRVTALWEIHPSFLYHHRSVFVVLCVNLIYRRQSPRNTVGFCRH